MSLDDAVAAGYQSVSENEPDSEKGIIDIYSHDLLEKAYMDHWEGTMMGKLAGLVTFRFGNKTDEAVDFLIEYCGGYVNMEFLDGLELSMNSKQLWRLLMRTVGKELTVRSMLKAYIGPLMETENLSLWDEAFRDLLVNYIASADKVNVEEMYEYVAILADHVGAVADIMILVKDVTRLWTFEERKKIVQAVVRLDMLQDCEGNIEQEVKEHFPTLQIELGDIQKDPEADKNGNLKGFVSIEDTDSEAEQNNGPQNIEDDEDGKESNPMILSEAEEDDDDSGSSEDEDLDSDLEDEQDMSVSILENLKESVDYSRKANIVVDDSDSDEEVEQPKAKVLKTSPTATPSASSSVQNVQEHDEEKEDSEIEIPNAFLEHAKRLARE